MAPIPLQLPPLARQSLVSWKAGNANRIGEVRFERNESGALRSAGVSSYDFKLFDGETPKEGEVINISENGNTITARVTRVVSQTGLLDHVEAVEI